ncbi:MAG: hypothetical protein ABIZ92_04105 [Vicinamibacterales bacterium]
MLLVCTVTAVAGCNRANPVAPAPPGPPALEITKFVVSPPPAAGGLQGSGYDLSLEIKEIGGQGGARINHLRFVDNLGSASETLCNSYLGPGATWNVISDYYCDPHLSIHDGALEVSVIVTFTGDDGVGGVISRSVEITR